IAGRRPFERNTAPETLTAIIREDHARLREVDATVPAEGERIVDRCLQKDPSDRYASTRDLARDLREAREALTNPSGRRSGSHLVPRVVPARRIAVATGAFVAIAVGLYFSMHQATPLQPPKFRSVAVLP